MFNHKRKKAQENTVEKMKTTVNKIIYFDKETIRNMLQEFNKGAKSTIFSASNSSSVEIDSKIEAETKLKFSVPFFARVAFLFSGKISARYITKQDNITTITSTEISDFEKIKRNFHNFENVILKDIENSSTFFRVAGGYLRILKGGVKDVDSKEFKNVMDGYEGYDHYKISENEFIRFNNTAFVSNYKRNDLLNSKLTIFCICVGEFDLSNFNFIEQLNKMQNLSTLNSAQTLADIYPSTKKSNDIVKPKTEPKVKLFDAVYACVSQGE